MSITVKYNNLKIWNINNWECILNLKNINKEGFLYSACFFNKYNEIYIICSNYNYNISEPIKIFDFNGKKNK